MTVQPLSPFSFHSFGELLKYLRRRERLTQLELSISVGYSEAQISRLEQNRRLPDMAAVKALFIPALHLEDEPEFTARFLELAQSAWQEDRLGRVPAKKTSTNLPVPLTSFIGREKEVKEIIRLLEKNRLVTLTGTGGIGKTRLAIQSSARLLKQFKDGVWWVELAPLTDGSLVPQTLATSLGVREVIKQSLNDTLINFLQPKQLLLVLDNCEHLIEACAQVANRLLDTCPALKILATSREDLGLTNELVWSVPMLSLPKTHQMSLADLLANYEGIRLFVERASASKPDFKLTEQNALSVAQICQRLDGIPLAIELAAVRVKMMSLVEIAKHLDDSFSLLTAGSRAAIPRHQTLHAAIDWSYELLSFQERILFKHLSVFAGGFTLDSAKEVATGDDLQKSQVIDLLGQLINKSLVVVEDRSEDPASETRYRMLETIRDFAREKLDDSGEKEHVQFCHRDFFVALAQQAEPKLIGAHQLEWLDRLEAEHDNLRVALDVTLKSGDVETTLKFAESLFWFWYRRSYFTEGRYWLERTLAVTKEPQASSVRAKVLYEEGYLARAEGDFTGAYRFIEQSIDIWKSLGQAGKHGLLLAQVLLGDLLCDDGNPTKARALIEESVTYFKKQADQWNLAWSLIHLGKAIRDQEDYDLAWSTIQESVRLWRVQDDLWGLVEALHHLGLIAYRRGDYESASALAEETLSIRRQLRDKQGIAYSIHNLGVFALAKGDIDGARSFFTHDLDLFREVGDKSGVVLALQYKGLFSRLQGDDVQAKSFYEEGLKLAAETGPNWISSNYFLWLADLATSEQQFERAASLCSAAKTQLDSCTSFWDAFERSYYERITALARASLGEEAFELAVTKGRGLSLEQATSLALSEKAEQ